MQKIIQNMLSNRISKAIIDILLLVGLVLSIKSARSADNSWGSFHCVVSMTWYALMLVHIWQHWRMTKALTNRKVLKRNKITFLTLVVFVLMTFSIINFISEVNDRFIHIHHVIAHIFWAVIIIHTVTKRKRFLQFFKTKNNLKDENK
jgi:hypothetical protein